VLDRGAQAAGSNSRETLFERRFEIVLVGPSRFEKRTGLKSGSSRPRTRSHNFAFSVG
jgi:hypothetical protein